MTQPKNRPTDQTPPPLTPPPPHTTLSNDLRELYMAPVIKAEKNLPEVTLAEILAKRAASGHSPVAASPLKNFTTTNSLQDASTQAGESCLLQPTPAIAFSKPSENQEDRKVEEDDDDELGKSIDLPTPASQDDADIIMKSDAAIQFVKSSVSLLEKALHTDHVLNIQKQLRALNVEDANVTSSFELSRVTFECGKYTAHRPVVGIACDPESTSIYVAYGSCVSSENMVGSTVGGSGIAKSLILKWSLDSESKPEDIFLCEVAEITCLTALPGEVVFAGTSGGNLVMWQSKRSGGDNVTTSGGGNGGTPPDTSGGSRPVQFVSSCMKGVVEIFAYGDGQVITLDEEFGAIIWAVGASVVEGQKYNLRGKHSKNYGSEFLIAVASEDDKNFIACGNDGHLWKAALKSGSDLASVTDLRDSTELAVPSLITTHLALQKPGAQCQSPLFIASSMYWTMTLWQIVRTRSNDSAAAEPKPLFCFEHQKATTHTTHVDWSPTHSHVFVNCTRDGWLALWDLNKSWAVPILSVDLKEELVRVAFSSDGKRIIVGHSSGKVTVGAVPVITTAPNDLPYFENMLKKYQ